MENSSSSVPQETVDQALGRDEAASAAIVQATETAIADSQRLLAEIAAEPPTPTVLTPFRSGFARVLVR
jgi:hypothetical protein